jgi:hypothetical protein
MTFEGATTVSRRAVVLTLAAVAVAVIWTFAARPAAADVTLHVNTKSDDTSVGDHQCSLRKALDYARGTAEPDCAAGTATGTVTIDVPAGCYELTAGELPAATTDPVMIDGAGPGPTACNGTGTVIDAEGDSTALGVGSQATTLNGLTITGGHAANGGCSTGYGCNGGGIVDASGTLTLDDVTVAGNSAGNGVTGGNPPDGGNGGTGGGIYDLAAVVTIEDSTISDNTAGSGGMGATQLSHGGLGGSGGGIYNDNGGTFTILDSTIVGNSAGAGGPGQQGGPGPGDGGNGGGIASNTGNTSGISLTNVTIYGNEAGAGGPANTIPASSPGSPGTGGGIDGPAAMAYVTVAGNQAPQGAQGAAIASNFLSETASVIADNGAGSPTSCVLAGGTTGDLNDIAYPPSSGCPGLVANPDLGPLQLNGGTVETVALLAGSPAIDYAPASTECPATDARGVTRPQGPACDAGAYEWAPPVLSSPSAHATSATEGVVQATVEPNLQGTSLVVRYGPTTYSSTSPSISAGAGNTAVAVSVPITGLTPKTTYQAELVATNPDGTATVQDLSFTTPAAISAPAITNVHQSARSWYAGKAAARLSSAGHPTGTTFTFKLNEAANVTFAFSESMPGRKVSGRCVKPSRSNRHKPHCTRTMSIHTLSFPAAGAGLRHLSFDGVLSPHQTMGPGTYTVTIVATAAGRRSTPHKLKFTILKRRHTV